MATSVFATSGASSRSVLRIVALVVVIANICYPPLHHALSGMPTEAEISPKYPTLFTPAGYAFAIWGVIYAAFTAYAVYALLPSQRGNAAHDRIAPAFIAYNLLGITWITVFRAEWLVASVVVIVAMLAAGIVMYLRASQAIERGELAGGWRAPFSLYLGWISVATIANTAVVLVANGWRGGRWDETSWTLVMIGVAVMLGLIIGHRRRDFVYPAVIAWASLAIYVARRGDHPDVAAAAWLAGIVLLGWCGLLAVEKLLPAKLANRETSLQRRTPGALPS
jgi:tryptophan-rich sensory protein